MTNNPVGDMNVCAKLSTIYPIDVILLDNLKSSPAAGTRKVMEINKIHLQETLIILKMYSIVKTFNSKSYMSASWCC